jgi:hypothetical protein
VVDPTEQLCIPRFRIRQVRKQSSRNDISQAVTDQVDPWLTWQPTQQAA